jgi:hypothetical protein
MMALSGNGSFPSVRLDRYVVAQNGADTIEFAGFVGYRDQLPVAVSGWNFGYKIGVAGSSACRDAVAEQAKPAASATANSNRAILRTWCLLQMRAK